VPPALLDARALMQKWLAHAQLQTMAIYASAEGEEERNIAEAIWE
jgi:hypothetical protein